MQSATMFSSRLKFRMFIFVAFGTLFCSSYAANPGQNKGQSDCCETGLWPNECLSQKFNESLRHPLNNYCKLSIELCCLLDRDHVPCNLSASKNGSQNICRQPEHCCVACRIGEELAERFVDCSSTVELRKFVTKQDAQVLQITSDCCKRRKQRREQLKIEVLVKSGKVLRFNRSTNKTEDVNECQIKNNGCYRSQRCVNKHGSYYCQPKDVCKNGFRYNRLTSTCDDIDECKRTKWACLQSEVCNNLLGSFTCYQPSCPEGYTISHSKRWTNYNKCTVRKPCANQDDTKCQPKTLIFKNVTLSTDLNASQSIVLYKISTKRFTIKPTYILNVFDKVSRTKIDQHDFAFAEKPTSESNKQAAHNTIRFSSLGTQVVLIKALHSMRELKITVVETSAEEVTEIVTIDLSVREN